MMIPAHALAGMTCIHLGLLFSRESKHWLWIGIVMAFFSHAIIDTLAIFTYHEGNPSGTMYSQFVFWFWMYVDLFAGNNRTTTRVFRLFHAFVCVCDTSCETDKNQP